MERIYLKFNVSMSPPKKYKCLVILFSPRVLVEHDSVQPEPKRRADKDDADTKRSCKNKQSKVK
jgi:hypothetical protein